MVYDLTRRSSFENVREQVEDLQSRAEPDAKVMLVGNKSDLCEEDPRSRQVTRSEGEELAKELGLMFAETSAARGDNVRMAFESLMQRISGC